MFFFRRRSMSSSNPLSSQTAAVEGLEDRRLLSAAALHVDLAVHPESGVHSHITHRHVGGTVVSIDTSADTITISSGSAGSATPTTYTVSPSATITASGKAVTLVDLVAGVKVVLTVASTDPTTATAITAVATKASGIVSAVDTSAGTITLTNRSGSASTTYTIPASATITVNRAAGTLGEITIGSTAHLLFSALSGTTVTAVASHSTAKSAPVDDSTSTTPTTSTPTTSTGTSTGTSSTGSTSTGSSTTGSTSGSSSTTSSSSDSSASSGAVTSNPATAPPSTSEWGTLVSVNTTADTITISTPAFGGASSTPTTYTLDPSATITADGGAAALGGLADGDFIALTLNTATPAAVTAVVAVGEKVDGQVTAVDTTTDTITLMPNDGGAAATYTIPSAASITVNGTAGTLAGIATGSLVKLQFSALSSTTVLSVNDFTLPSGGGLGFGGGGFTGQQQIAFGTLVSVNTTADTITLSTPAWDSASATQTTYTLGSSASITADGAASTLGALAVGDQIFLKLDSTTTPPTVTSVTATGMALDGQVTAVNTTADTITLTPDNGSASTTVTIPSAATITVDGSAGTLAGITTGSQIHIQYSALNSATITSVDDFTLPLGLGGGAPGQNGAAFGTLVSVNTTADTITLSSPTFGSGSATQTTYTLGSSATVTADGAASTLGALAVGDQIFLKLDSTATPPTVTTVTATGMGLDGAVTAVNTTADTITLTPDDGSASTTVTIPSAATITVDGSTGTLAGITTGSLVHIQYSALDSTTITSVDDFALPTPPGGGFGQNGAAFGTLVSVNTTADTITLSSPSFGSGSATQTTYTLGSSATITADGAASTLGALAVGDQIFLKLDSSTTPATVTSVTATGMGLDGQVTAVNTTADTITLTPDNGSASTTVTIPGSATIMVNGSSGTLAGITTGSEVHIQYSALDSTTIISVDDFTKVGGFGGPGGGGGTLLQDHAFGTLVSVDTTADTITLSSPAWGSGSATQTTYTLGSSATITADGATATLGSLAVGDQIVLSLTSATPATVTTITASGTTLDGQVTAVDTTADTITLTPDNGSASTTVTIPSGATITVNGSTATLADITTGAQVHIQYSALDNTQVISVIAFTLPAGWGGIGGGGLLAGSGLGGGLSTSGGLSASSGIGAGGFGASGYGSGELSGTSGFTESGSGSGPGLFSGAGGGLSL